MEGNISLETSQKLYELGLRSFALEYWVEPTELMPGNESGEAPAELMPYDQGLDTDGGDLDGMNAKEFTVLHFFKHPNEFWNVYAAYNFSEIRAIVPHNVEVNENVKEIGYKETDLAVEKWGKLLVWLLENNAVTLNAIEKGYSNA